LGMKTQSHDVPCLSRSSSKKVFGPEGIWIVATSFGFPSDFLASLVVCAF